MPCYGFLYKEEDNHVAEYKRKGKAQKADIHQNQKMTHSTTEFVIVTLNGGCALLNLAPTRVAVVRQAVRQTDKNMGFDI